MPLLSGNKTMKRAKELKPARDFAYGILAENPIMDTVELRRRLKDQGFVVASTTVYGWLKRQRLAEGRPPKARSRTKNLEISRLRAYRLLDGSPDLTTSQIKEILAQDGYDASTRSIRRWKSEHKREKAAGYPKPMQLTFDQVTEAIIFAFEQAALVPSLKEQVYRLENKLAATKNELSNLQKYYKEKEDQSKRFRLAQQQGEIGNKGD